MKIVGLTGGIACGKSTVSNLLRELGVPVIDADRVARQVVAPGTGGYRAVVRAFGEGITESPGGPIDRQRLGEVVFKDRGRRKVLERITHPAIAWRIFVRLLRHFARATPVVVLDLPLLYESGPVFPLLCSRVVLIASSREFQLQRLMSRDHLSEEAALARIHAQMPLELKIARANLVLWNDASVSDLHELVTRRVYQPLLSPTLGRRLAARSKLLVAIILLFIPFGLIFNAIRVLF